MYTYKIWDGKSSINGIGADIFKKEYKMDNEQKAYLVYRDERLVYFQPHNPFEAGAAIMDDDNIEAIAAQHVKELNDNDSRAEEDVSEIAMLKKQLAEMQEIINKTLK